MLFYSFLILNTFVWAKSPDWLNNSTSRTGAIYTTTCSATAPSLETARSEAIGNCKSSALEELSVNTRFNNTIIQTEKNVAVHSIVEAEGVIKNLKCDVKKEQVDDLSGSFQIWLMCEFNLKKTEVVQVQPKEIPSSNTLESINDIKLKNVKYRDVSSVDESFRTISISVTPICDDLLIKGNRSRIVKCKNNPISLVLSKEDSELIVRKNGFESKTIYVNELLGGDDENIAVFLNPL